MCKKLKKIKLELFYIRKCFFQYRKGLAYFYYNYFLAKSILKSNKVLEKPINNDSLSIHVLVQHSDLIIMFWSLASFYQVTKIRGQLIIHDDGTLTKRDKYLIAKFFPSAVLINTRTFVIDFAGKLDKYPFFKEFRIKYNNYFSFKKIIDPYFVSDKKIHLIIDTDILWFKNPVEIEKEIENGCEKSFMQKNNSRIFASFEDGTKLDKELSFFNAGIILYRKDNFDLEKFSDFLKCLDKTDERNLHFADQTGYAYCLKNLEFLSKDRYIIKSSVAEDTIAKHYTGPRRPLFYINGIKILKDKIL